MSLRDTSPWDRFFVSFVIVVVRLPWDCVAPSVVVVAMGLGICFGKVL